MKNIFPFGYASVPERAVAMFIDLLIISLISWTFIGIGGVSVSENHVSYGGAGLGALAGIAYVLYFWVQKDGQTLGKKFMGIKVATVSGKPLDLGVAITRYIGYLISGIVLNLGYIWAIFDKNKQAWHDKMAGTYVVKVDNEKRQGVIVAFFILIGLTIIGFITTIFILLVAGVAIFSAASKDPKIMNELKGELDNGQMMNQKYDYRQDVQYKLKPTGEL